MRHLAQLLALLAVAVPACRSAPADRGAAGDGGAPARRIVSLDPSLTELLFALGAGSQVVGRTVYCRYPPAALAVPSVGEGMNPNVEAVVARRPDLVLMYRSPLNEAAASQLEALGIRALLLRDDRLDSYAGTARRLGRLTGHPAAGDSIARLMDSLAAAPAPPPRARIAIVVWDQPPIVIGSGSYLDELASRAGAVNVFHDLSTASATAALETIAARDPDWIAVLRDSADTTRPAWAARREWRTIRAVRDGRFLFLPAELFGQPSARALEAVTYLRRVFAPQ